MTLAPLATANYVDHSVGVRGADEAATVAAAPPNEACARCADCGHWSGARSSLEVDIPGLVSLGSGFGASAADTRVCRLHDRLTSPRDQCRSFVRHST
jgi:hypothetical protein